MFWSFSRLVGEERAQSLGSLCFRVPEDVTICIDHRVLPVTQLGLLAPLTQMGHGTTKDALSVLS